MKTSGILFLEVGISDPKKMIDLMLDRSRFAKTGEFGFLDRSVTMPELLKLMQL